MADGSTFSDAGKFPADSSHSSMQEISEKQKAFTKWTDEQLKFFESHKTETIVASAAAAGVVVADVATHGALSGLAKKALTGVAEGATGAKALSEGSLSGGEKLATANSFSAGIMRVDDARLVSADKLLKEMKPKPVSLGLDSLPQWQEAELLGKINGDKGVRGLTLDVREGMARHGLIGQDLHIATQDKTLLTEDSKRLKNLTNEDPNKDLPANASPQLKRLLSAKDAARAARGPEESQQASESLNSAQTAWENARTKAGERLALIEGTSDKPGLLNRLDDHMTVLRTRADAELSNIDASAKQLRERVDSLRAKAGDSNAFETPSSEEDIALRRREAALKSPQKGGTSILTSEERTGIAPPPPRPVVETKEVAPKPADTSIKTTTPDSSATSATTSDTTASRPVRAIDSTSSTVRFAGVPDGYAATGIADLDATLNNKLRSAYDNVQFHVAHPNTGFRNSLQSIHEYAESVAKALKAEKDPKKVSDIATSASTNMEKLLQPISSARTEVWQQRYAKKIDLAKFEDLRSEVKARLDGITQKAPREVQGRAELAGKTTPEFQTAFERLQSDFPKLSQKTSIFAVRTDGTIVETTINGTPPRIAPMRHMIAQDSETKNIGDSLRFKFGDQPISGFVIVENKGASQGREFFLDPANKVPDQIIKGVSGDVKLPPNVTAERASYKHFKFEFDRQQKAAQRGVKDTNGS